MRKISISFALASCLVAFPAFAEDSLQSIFDRVIALEKEGQFAKAISELAWAKSSLQDKNEKKVLSLLPAKLGEFVGNDGKSIDALGITATEKEYTSGSSRIKLSLIGGGNAGPAAANNPFAALGQMALLAGGMDPTAKQVRINGRTASMKEDKGARSAELTLGLKNGSTIRIEAQNFSDVKKLEELVQGANFDDLEKYLAS